MDDISRISADRSFQLTESLSVRILICYLLKKLDRPVTTDQLYEIAVGNDIINYFYYTEAINELIKNETILIKKTENGEIYILAEKGMYGAEEFKKYVPKTFREKLLSAALKYFAKLKMESEVKCQLIESQNGYYVKCEILDSDYNLMELKLFAPDEEQAKLVMDRILLNPTDFYGKVIGFALENKEYEPVIED